MMNTLNVPYFKFKVDDHKTLKPLVLEAIGSMGVNSIDNYRQKIYNTDWHTGDVERPYIDLLVPWYNHACHILTDVYDDDVMLDNTWFQQYQYGDFHGWHSHTTFYNGIYYVELPEDASRTTVKIPNEFNIDVQEGDILLLPGNIIHQSKPNLSDGRKTVIVFNIMIQNNYAQ